MSGGGGTTGGTTGGNTSGGSGGGMMGGIGQGLMNFGGSGSSSPPPRAPDPNTAFDQMLQALMAQMMAQNQSASMNMGGRR